MKKLILAAIVVSLFSPVLGQDFIDNALLFSRLQPTGSSRIQAMGGAQVALGGDYSSALSNPAGLGMYNRSEYAFSIGVNSNKSASDYLGETVNENKSVFNVPGFSIIFHSPSQRETGFLGGSFAITLSRVNDFQQKFSYSGTNDFSTILDHFVEDAGTIEPEDMLIDQYGNMGSYYKTLTALAYNNYLIEENVDDNGHVTGYSKLLFSKSRQQETSDRTGAQYQWSIAYGANISDKFFLGANLGVSTLRYKLVQNYQEDSFVFPPDLNPISNFMLEEEFDIQGTGFNGTFGATYRIIDFLQLGVSYTTPTSYNLKDEYFASMQSDWNDPDEDVYEDFREPDILEYKLKTPGRFRAGLAFINKIGLLTSDIEVVNYAKAKYTDKNDSYDFEESNSYIGDELKSVVNVSLGGELRLKAFRFRLGWNLMKEPYSEFVNDVDPVDRKLMSYSSGIGYRGKSFYIDLAGIYSSTEGKRYPYFLNNGPDPVAIQEFNSLRFVSTIGFFF